MIYQNLFEGVSSKRLVRVGLIGAGHFGTAVVTQAPYIPLLEVLVVADVNVETARLAYLRAGIADDRIVVCDNEAAALRAMEMGNFVIVEDAMLLMKLPVDVVAESTGIPEAGALHAYEAIRHGKHVAMITKETDATVGPLLTHLATKAGLVYSPVDGDQHGLLIGLVSWARSLGLDILCGGKARDAEFVYDLSARTVHLGKHEVVLEEENAWVMRPIPPGDSARYVEARRRHLAELPQLGGFDITELVIATNATGLMPDTELTHHPIAHIKELPEIFCHQDEGGILRSGNVIDVATCFRQPHEAGLSGGVFITVSCKNDYSRMILATKGLITNSKSSSMVIYRPYHLCGVETPISILCAGLAQITTGGRDVLPRTDIVARTTRNLKAGELVGNDHSPDLQAVMLPATKTGEGVPLPLHMANGHRLSRDVSAGQFITQDMVVASPDSILWRLRAEQDNFFFKRFNKNPEH